MQLLGITLSYFVKMLAAKQQTLSIQLLVVHQTHQLRLIFQSPIYLWPPLTLACQLLMDNLVNQLQI